MVLEQWNAAIDGPLSEASFRRKLEARGYRCTVYHYAPGTFFPEHSHPVDKIDGVLSGRLRICMNGTAHVLEAGDCIAVPRGQMHTAEVIGDSNVVSIDAVRS